MNKGKTLSIDRNRDRETAKKRAIKGRNAKKHEKGREKKRKRNENRRQKEKKPKQEGM